MPNATLCGKAVAEMLLATDLDLAILDYIQNKLVKDGDLPRAYVVSKERMEQCKGFESVREQDRRAEWGSGRLMGWDGMVGGGEERGGVRGGMNEGGGGGDG